MDFLKRFFFCDELRITKNPMSLGILQSSGYYKVIIRSYEAKEPSFGTISQINATIFSQISFLNVVLQQCIFNKY